MTLADSTVVTLNWIWLTVALVLLGPPPVLSSELRRIVGSVRQSELVGVTALLRPWQNWLDSFRAFVGCFLLTHNAVLPGVLDSTAQAFLIRISVLAAALVAQTLRIHARASRPEQRLQLLAPIFYLSGMTVALSGFVSGTFAVLAGWAFAIAGKRPLYQLPAMAVALAATGLIFGRNLELYGNLSLIVIPFALAFLFRKRLAFVGLVVRFSKSVLKQGTA